MKRIPTFYLNRVRDFARYYSNCWYLSADKEKALSNTGYYLVSFYSLMHFLNNNEVYNVNKNGVISRFSLGEDEEEPVEEEEYKVIYLNNNFDPVSYKEAPSYVKLKHVFSEDMVVQYIALEIYDRSTWAYEGQTYLRISDLNLKRIYSNVLEEDGFCSSSHFHNLGTYKKGMCSEDYSVKVNHPVNCMWPRLREYSPQVLLRRNNTNRVTGRKLIEVFEEKRPSLRLSDSYFLTNSDDCDYPLLIHKHMPCGVMLKIRDKYFLYTQHKAKILKKWITLFDENTI